MFLFLLITFDFILGDFLRFWTNPEIQAGGWDRRRSEMIAQLLRHVTSSPHDADVKGDILRRTIYLPSLVVIAFIFSELRRGGGFEEEKKPGLNRVKDGTAIYSRSSKPLKDLTIYIF